MKHLFFEAFVSELAIAPKDRKAQFFEEGILHGLAGHDIMPGHRAFILPSTDHSGNFKLVRNILMRRANATSHQLLPRYRGVVSDDRLRLSAEPDEVVQFAGNSLTRQEMSATYASHFRAKPSIEYSMWDRLTSPNVSETKLRLRRLRRPPENGVGVWVPVVLLRPPQRFSASPSSR